MGGFLPASASIFVVDDDEVIRATFSKWLARQHHRVRTFDSGESLADGLAQDVPDLVLLDLKLPGMNGIEALRLLRQRAPRALVIMMTAYSTPQEAVEAMKEGAYDFVIKSGDPWKLQAVIDGALEFLASRGRRLPGL